MDSTSLYVRPAETVVLAIGTTEPGAGSTKDERLRGSLMMPPSIDDFGQEIGTLSAKMRDLSGGDELTRYLFPAALSFLFASLWLFTRVSHWKALNLLLALIAFRGFFFLANAATGELLGSLVDQAFPGAGRDNVAMIAFAVIGLLLVAWDFARGVFGRSREEG